MLLLHLQYPFCATITNTTQGTSALIHILISSRIDSGNAMYSDLGSSLTLILQSVLNASARPICGIPKFSHNIYLQMRYIALIAHPSTHRIQDFSFHAEPLGWELPHPILAHYVSLPSLFMAAGLFIRPIRVFSPTPTPTRLAWVSAELPSTTQYRSFDFVSPMAWNNLPCKTRAKL